MNGTGPRGEGPKTGRGMGKCGGNDPENNTRQGNGKGLGRKNCPNRGLGLGRGRNQNQASS